VAVLLVALGLASVPQATAASTLPAGFVLRDQPTGQAGYDLTDFGYLPDNGGILTTGKSGKLTWISPGGDIRTLANLTVKTMGDLGLTGLAIAPDYATTHHIYLVRAVPDGNGFHFRLARWTVTGAPEPTGIGEEQVLLDVVGNSGVHGMTGVIAADDGTIWLSIGDDSDFVKLDPLALRTQDVNAWQGKILHLAADGAGVPGNPYYDATDPNAVHSKVFARGFRSPFRFSLDPSSGLPVVGDVGWNTWEEVDVVQPGRNYAWPCWEGTHQTPGYMDLPECANVPNQPPIWDYHHGSGSNQGNSVTGGIVYTGASYPTQYKGLYFFGDYVTNKIWTARYDSTGQLTQAPQNPAWATDIGGPVKFAAAPNGDLVYADIVSGNLRRISYSQGNSAPVAKATSSTDPDTRTVTFDSTGSLDYDGDALTYRWDFGDGTTGTGATATHTYAPGTDRFTATLTVRDPLGASGSAQLTVAPSNHSPELTLTVPGNPNFAVNEQVDLGATATDTEDGALPVTWTSLVLHCPEEATCHAHPGVGATGSTFGVPFTEHPDSRMVITATATDSAGVSTTKTYTALPRQHRLTLLSNLPASLQIPSESGGNSALVTEGVTLDAVASATASDGASTFTAWADGPSSRTRTLTMGTSDLTLTANYATPIEQRYNSDTALQQRLGAPTAPEVSDGDVRYRVYEKGRLYWSSQTGVHEMHGQILTKYLALGGHSKFGAPKTDELSTPDGIGRYNHFIGTPGTMTASVYFTPGTGAHAIWGAIREKWSALNWETGPLGYPTTDELTTPDGVGRYNHFDKAASVYWTPANGAHGIWGQIRVLWQQLGWETGPLGYPATDELSTPDGVGRYNHFGKAASIYWAPGTGAHEVYGAIRQRWSALGWERSYLGYPTSGEFGADGGRRNNFQYGYIQWYPNGTIVDRRY
jgi:glucose/arabinose dehydrogenase